MPKNLKQYAEAPVRLTAGHRLCPGCGEPTAARQVLMATDKPVLVANATGCFEVSTTIFPFTAWNIPWLHVAFENAAAVAAGMEAMYVSQKAQGNLPEDADYRFVAFGGDGGTYDIGFQCLSSAAERNEDFLYVCLDNEGYMNTGAQKSSSTPHFARTGSTPAGKTSRKKNLPEIMAAHGVPYVATASASHLPDLVAKIRKAKGIRGTRIVTVLIPCLDGWGLPDDMGLAAARYAVECGAFPLYEIEDGVRYTLNVAQKPRPVSDYLALQRRYRGLPDADVATLQAEIDAGWAKLVERSRPSPPGAARAA